MVDPQTIEGYWYGVYDYVDTWVEGIVQTVTLPSTPFRAQFTCGSDGSLAGSIADEAAVEIGATIEGRVAGGSFTFVKRYVPGTISPLSGRLMEHPVQYVGTVSPDGTMLTGTWSIEAIVSGRRVIGRGTWRAERYVPA